MKPNFICLDNIANKISPLIIDANRITGISAACELDIEYEIGTKAVIYFQQGSYFDFLNVGNTPEEVLKKINGQSIYESVFVLTKDGYGGIVGVYKTREEADEAARHYPPECRVKKYELE